MSTTPNISEREPDPELDVPTSVTMRGRPAAPSPDDASGIRPVDKAYSRIRDAILSGQLPPGEHLREEALTAMTGTSRTPVRDALSRLVGEGLARTVNRHRYVSDFSFDEVVIIFDVRARLEGYAAQIAAHKITADEIAQLRSIIEEIDRVIALDINALEHFRRLNAKFHATIIGAAKSAQLQTLIAPTVALPLESIKRQMWEQPIRMVRSNEQHREIVAALEAGDAQLAAVAMSNHILSTKPRSTRARPA